MITDILEILESIKMDVPILYYVTYCGFFLITLSYMMKSNFKIKENSLTNLVGLLVTIISIIFLATKEPIVFAVALIVTVMGQSPKIVKFIADNSHSELNRYKEHYTRIVDQQSYSFLEILFLYNLISLEDYSFLFTKHADKSEDEMIKILEERVILDADKKETAMILFNQYKLNKKLILRDDKIIEDIKKELEGDDKR